MATYTVNHARKVLGRLAQGVTDEQIEKDIEAASFLKDIFFDQLHVKESKLATEAGTQPHNVP